MTSLKENLSKEILHTNYEVVDAAKRSLATPGSVYNIIIPPVVEEVVRSIEKRVNMEVQKKLHV